ncbi:PEP/pyruvate-binding domain-containing protein [Plantactinospora solaniradicis]|uniref:PEP/pyruvate-binding domain-containing protein n=1 Tax=Plantactinospora solaniradicis TaxID=1723736 RepID=A0ABW1KLX9_9ACTN
MASESQSYVADLASHLESHQYGAKASNLSVLATSGYPVPSGIALSVAGARGFGATAEASTREAVLAEICASSFFESLKSGADCLIVRSSSPEEDGVRSSYAGIFRSVPGVPPDRHSLARALDVCVGSATSDSAELYRRAVGSRQIGRLMGAVVQSMVDVKANGVIFTDVRSSIGNVVLIEYNIGKLSTVVSGMEVPGRCVINRANGRSVGSSHTCDSSMGTLTSDLFALAIRIEFQMGGPQDIEWVYDGRSVWVVQSRPITRDVFIR